MVTAYVPTERALFVVTGGTDGADDGLGDWRVAERLSGHDLESVACAPDAPGRVLCGTVGSGVVRSTDGGRTWEQALDVDARVTAVTTSPHDPAEAWAGTEPSALYRSRDGGTTWEELPPVSDLDTAGEWSFPPRPHTHHVRTVALDPHDPDRVYVGIEAGALLVSDDAGATWTERPPGARRDNHALATHPDAPGRVYAAAGDGYAESFDGGRSWEHPQKGLDHRYVWGLAVDAGDPDTVFVSAASGARGAHYAGGESYVYRRRGDGWERLDDRGLPTGRGVRRAVLATTREPGTVYAAIEAGLFRSVDAGDRWERVAAWPGDPGLPRGLAVVE